MTAPAWHKRRYQRNRRVRFPSLQPGTYTIVPRDGGFQSETYKTFNSAEPAGTAQLQPETGGRRAID